MNTEKEFQFKSQSKNYILATDEYIGSKDFKYMIRSELRDDNKVTLFLMGIPDPAKVYASSANNSQDSIKENLYTAVIDSISKFIGENEWKEGGIYYGEYSIDGSFEIGAKKPEWEDGNWGQKI